MRQLRTLTATLAALSLALSAGWASAQATSDEQRIKDLVLRDALSQGIDKAPEIQAAMRSAQETILIRAWERKLLASQGISQDLKNAVYKELADTLGDAEYRIYHVFSGDEKAARTLIQSMTATPDWGKIDLDALFGQKDRYTHRQTDWVNLSSVLPEFRQSVRRMKSGQVVDQPIQAKDGWHVVGLQATRPFKLPPPAQMDAELIRLAERRIVGEKIKSMLAPPGGK